jgi:hypothetical protein
VSSAASHPPELSDPPDPPELSDPPDPPDLSDPPDDREVAQISRGRALAVTLAVVACGCLVAACLSHRWLGNRYRGDFGYSLRSYEVCTPECASSSNFQVYENAKDFPFAENRVSPAFPIAGLIAFIALWIAAAGLAVAAALAVADRHPDLPVSPTTFALLGLMIGIVSGCVFAATKPGPVGAVGAAWGFWAFGLGAVAGIAGAQLLAKQIRPRDPDLLHDAMNADQF